jgi:hypothetical protein
MQKGAGRRAAGSKAAPTDGLCMYVHHSLGSDELYRSSQQYMAYIQKQKSAKVDKPARSACNAHAMQTIRDLQARGRVDLAI